MTLMPMLSVVALAVTVMPEPSKHAHGKSLTARQVIERIQRNVGVPWRDQTLDTFKAGNPDAPITGIATTMMATLDVLQKAAASGKNLIITHEPTFYNHRDETAAFESDKDAVYAAKQAFIKEHNLIVWRFHDFWHARRPDGILTGMVKALGWEKNRSPKDAHLFTLPKTKLGRLASDIKKRMGIKVMRVVGDANIDVSHVALVPGWDGINGHKQFLQRDDVEVLVIGETYEWETVEYVADAVTEKKRKALIIMGHIPSEQAGMEECARWLKTFVTEAPVEFIPASEPFWSPK